MKLDAKVPPGPLAEKWTAYKRSQKLVTDFLARQEPGGAGNLDPLNIGAAFMEMTHRMMADPAKLVQAQMTLWQDYMRLWQSTAQRMMGQESEPVATRASSRAVSRAVNRVPSDSRSASMSQ